MGSSCQCQQKIDENEYDHEAFVDDEKDKGQSQDQVANQKEKEKDQQNQQTIEIDPIQLKSYEIEDNCPQGLMALTVQAQQEFLDQFPAVVKKLLKKLPKLKLKASLSPNYQKIPHIETPYQLLNGDVYVGQWAEGKPYGLGKIYYADQQVYEGQIVDGIPDGEGRKIFKDGSVYTGQFKMGEIIGKGIYEKGRNGFKYDGSFLNGMPHGQGIETWPDQTTYQGFYVLGKKQGLGTFTWGKPQSKSYTQSSDTKPGETQSKTQKSQIQSKKDTQKKDEKYEYYVGEFFNDVFHGKGKYEWLDGRTYDGDWVEGKMEGKGEFIWPDKRKYKGGYLKDLKSGQGDLEWPDGKKLSGFWRLGKLNGLATLTIKGKLKEDGKEREPDRTFLSEWEDGKRIRWVDNQQPSGMHSNVSYQRYFDEHQQQNQSQLLPSQIKQDQKSNGKDSKIEKQIDQQQKTVFQQNTQKQTQEDSSSQQQQAKQKQVQPITQNKENVIQFENDNQFDKQKNQDGSKILES